MATTTCTLPTFSVTIGRTDAEFTLQREREWDIDGRPFWNEYLALPYGAEVKELRHSQGEADTYADAAALARLVASTAPAGSIVRFSVSDGTGLSFMFTGWLPLDDALEDLSRLIG